MPPRHAPRRLRPRKTPLQPRAEETVASIVEAAAQVLENDGFEGFNTNAVAKRAGVSIGSLYQYFPSKDALTVALIRRETTRFHDDMAVALTKKSAKTALEYVIGACVRQQLRRPRLARLLDIEEGRPALRRETASGEIERLFTTVVQRAIPKHARPGVVAADVFSIIRGIVDGAGERGETDIDDVERRLKAAVFGYLARSGKD